ncbi:MAG TPA: hypothetical protein VEA16_21130, partial [Vicinamibacterales bacterium]|nr:hypothetical protein [Vicinamibacterales bacterium]
MSSVAAAALVVAVCAAALWPLPVRVSDAINGHTDALFGAWRLAWIANALATSASRIFDAPIFFPQRWTLAYSDAVLLSGVLTAPLTWAGLSPLQTYNVFVMFSVVSAGLLAMALGHAVTRNWWAGAIGGIIYTINPHRM